MSGLFVAAAFLTRVPVAMVAGAREVGRAARWFPLVGGALGGAAALAGWGMRDAIGMPPALSAAVLVGLGAWITGAIHLDGLADMADGFGGGRTREDVLRIMRDPAIGSYGAVTLVVVITMNAFAALRIAAIAPWAFVTAVTVMLGRAARRRIGGVTGDVFGAGVELAETTVLVSGVLLTGRA